MVLKLTIVLLFLHFTFFKVTYSYLGCADNLVPCLNKTHCIPIEEVCVGYRDCVNEAGDKICHYCHEPGLRACVTQVEPSVLFECLSPTQICNKKKDCFNNEDEYSCGIRQCQQGFWLCQNGSCIEKHRLCDKHKDCSDGSDEGEICHRDQCGPNKIPCPTGECIPATKMCDGIEHCSDGYDEQDCKHTIKRINDSCSIPSNEFTCSTLMKHSRPICIPRDRVCDGNEDCPKGDDERDCYHKCDASASCFSNSNITCIQHPTLHRLCRCSLSGYKIINNSLFNNMLQCQDFDECQDPFGTYCSYECSNTLGSFDCKCPSGFNMTKNSKSCAQINDETTGNLLLLLDNFVNLYNIKYISDSYSIKLLGQVHLYYPHTNSVQYDTNENFVIYYNKLQNAIYCQTFDISNPIVLISNVSVTDFAYDMVYKSLFFIENLSETLRMYAPIICSTSSTIEMHSWPFKNKNNSIHSIEIDIYQREFVFASDYEIMTSSMSKPNSVDVVYRTNQKIERMIYDSKFKRIFWTATNTTDDDVFPVYTCDYGFKRCHDTFIRLPYPWPFGFYNDGLIFPSVALQSLYHVQIYGTNRFNEAVITSIVENIRSISVLYQEPMKSANYCSGTIKKLCPNNQICLQINSTHVNCLSVDDQIQSNNFIRTDSIQALPTGTQSLSKPNKFGSKLLIVLSICMAIGGIAAALVLFTRRLRHFRHQNLLNNEYCSSRQYLSTDEPNLDEFSVMVDERNGDRSPLTNQLHY